MPTAMLYSKAPITEATIDLRIALPEDFTPGHLEAFQAPLGDAYSEKQDILVDEWLVEPGARGASYSNQQIGYRFVNADKRRIVQARRDGFAFSLLAPYERWEKFSQEARGIWEQFRDHVRPAAIGRLSVRYINRLDIPAASVELKKYLATVPEIADGMPQTIQSYFMQIVLPMEDAHATAIVNQALVPPPVPGTTSILLDIDLFRDQDVPQDEQGIWQAFEELRTAKNRIFDATLTQDAKELIS